MFVLVSYGLPALALVQRPRGTIIDKRMEHSALVPGGAEMLGHGAEQRSIESAGLPARSDCKQAHDGRVPWIGWHAAAGQGSKHESVNLTGG